MAHQVCDSYGCGSIRIPEQVQETLRGTHPIRRLGTPEDVAQTALPLASDNSTWISGIVVDVAGGSVLL